MRSLWRLSAFLHPYRWQVLLALLALFGLTAAQLAVPAIIRQVIDVGLAQQEVRFLFLSAFLILGLGLLRSIFNYCQR